MQTSSSSVEKNVGADIRDYGYRGTRTPDVPSSHWLGDIIQETELDFNR